MIRAVVNWKCILIQIVDLKMVENSVTEVKLKHLVNQKYSLKHTGPPYRDEGYPPPMIQCEFDDS